MKLLKINDDIYLEVEVPRSLFPEHKHDPGRACLPLTREQALELWWSEPEQRPSIIRGFFVEAGAGSRRGRLQSHLQTLQADSWKQLTNDTGEEFLEALWQDPDTEDYLATVQPSARHL